MFFIILYHIISSDIDECSEGTCGCSEICASFKYLCNSGFQQGSDKVSCSGMQIILPNYGINAYVHNPMIHWYTIYSSLVFYIYLLETQGLTEDTVDRSTVIITTVTTITAILLIVVIILLITLKRWRNKVNSR